MALPITPELIEGKELSFKEIQEMVIKYGFGLTPFDIHKIHCAMSHGINYALLTHSISVSELESAIARFMNGDWGTFYDFDEEPIKGKEYGCYPSSFGDNMQNGAIMVHREQNPMIPWELVAYFQFER